MFSMDPSVDWATATKPGTPQLPPLSQGRDPSGLLMALASNPPIKKYVPLLVPVPMRKNDPSAKQGPAPPSTPTKAMKKRKKPKKKNKTTAAHDPTTLP
jgi:hypothetical protein